MQIDNLSYPLNTDRLKVKDYIVSTEIFTFENVYFPAKNSFEAKENGYVSTHLCYADNETANGVLHLEKEEKGDCTSFTLKAEMDQPIRSIKLRFDGLPIGTLLTSINRDLPITEEGMCLTYPEGWRGLIAPFLVFDVGHRYLCIRSLSSPVKEHRFYLRKTCEGMRVDVVYEEDACLRSNSIITPKIECFYSDSLEDIYASEEKYLKNTYHLVPFEKRTDVPAWFKDISLVVTCHMEAYTGKIFHTYEQAKKDILALANKLGGEHILVYLPGWEGRYYYKYGNYTPDDRLGGSDALKDMVNALHEKGVRVMAMYGMTMANVNLPGYDSWGRPAEFATNGGGYLHNGSVDWEGGHHCDSSFLRQLNVGVTCYQDHIFEEIRRSTLEFNFDGCFLDIAACHVNDRNAKHYQGVLELCARLRSIKKDFLIAGEGYYDGLAVAMPLFQSGHTQGEMHYHDRFAENLFTPYCREFAHLCLGDPSRGSTGVHELGTNPERMAPNRKGIIPTLTLVDGSLQNAPEKVEEVLKQAQFYAEEYCNG